MQVDSLSDEDDSEEDEDEEDDGEVRYCFFSIDVMGEILYKSHVGF